MFYLMDSQQFLGEKGKDNDKDNRTELRSFEDQNGKDPAITNLSNQDKYTSVAKFHQYLEFFKTLQLTPFPQQKLSANKEPLFHHLINCFFNQKNYQADEKIKESSSLDQTTATVFSQFQSKFQCQTEKAILKSQKFKKSSFFTKDLKIHEVRSSKASKIIQLQMQLHWYKVDITILNEMQQILPFKSNQISSSGSFGRIYFAKIFDEFLAVKCIPIEKLPHINQSEIEDNSELTKNTKIFINTLREFFFVLLFSELQIGPQLKTIGGFDMVVFQGSILFATEICSSSRQMFKINDLKQSLFRMHMLQIVHRDIKPANFMYSKTHKKNVFIDFGCTQVLDAKIGEKSLTHFAGTTMFCSDEMLFLLKDNKIAVDLYFNDIFGLEKCSKQTSHSANEIKQNNFNFIKNYKTELLSLKFALFTANDEGFEQKWKIIIREYPENFEEIERQVLQFFRYTKPRYSLRRFYEEQISENTKEQAEFQDLQILMKDESSLKRYYLKSHKSKENAKPDLLFFFELIVIQLGTLTKQKKEISFKLLNKITAQKFMHELIAKLQRQDNVQDIDSENEDFINLCSMVMHYCSLADNPFDVSIAQKVKICKKMSELVIKIYSKTIQLMNVVFQCQIVSLEPICLFSQFFLFYVFQHIAFQDKSSLMIKAVGNLCLLGVPLFQLNQKQQWIFNYFINKVIFNLHASGKDTNDHKSSKKQIQDIQKIVLFWELRNCVMMLGKNFYGQRKDVLEIDKYILKSKKFIDQNEEFIAQQRNTNKEFFSTNYKLSSIICNQNKAKLNEKQFEELFQLIRSIKIPQDQQLSKLIIRWKKTLCVSICSLIIDWSINKASQIIKLFEQERVLDYFFERRLLGPQLLLFYWDKIYNRRDNISLILREIDERIGCKDISLRLQIERRFQLALNVRDFQTLREIGHLISCQINLQDFVIQNLFLLNLMTTQIFYFALQMKKAQTANEQFSYILDSCNNILSIAMQFGINWIINNDLDKEFFKNKVKNHTDYEMKVNLFQAQIYNIQLKSLFYTNLEEIGNLHREYKESLRIKDNELIQKQKLKSFQQTSKELENNNSSVKWQEKYQEFRIKLNQSKINDNLFSRIIENIYTQENHKSFIKGNSLLSISLATVLIHYRERFQQYLQYQEIIKEIFGELSQNRLIEFTSQLNTKNFGIAFEFIRLEIFKIQYDIFWCQQYITLYKICRKKDFIFSFFSQKKSINHLFNCLICTRESFGVIKEVFVQFSLIVKKYLNREVFQLAKINLKCIFKCKCKKRIFFIPKDWSLYKFGRFLYEKVKEEKVHDNPYLSLVYFQLINSQSFPNEIIRAIVMYILRSMSYLISPAKQFILTGLYDHIYSIYRDKVKIKDQFLSDGISKTTGSLVKSPNNKNTDSIFETEKRGSSLSFNKQALRKKFQMRIKKSEMNDKVNRKFIYCYNQTLKHNDPQLDEMHHLILYNSNYQSPYDFRF